MDLTVTYGAPSDVEVSGRRARVHLSGARERPRLSFRGVVREPIAFREALAALHDVALADFRWRPPAARVEFDRWLARELDRRADAERARLDASRRRLLELRFREERALFTALDPVATVHPDQVFFEVLSRDGSAYARVGLDRSAFSERGETVCGTTNVDFTSGLHESFRRLRSIFETELALGDVPEPGASGASSGGAGASGASWGGAGARSVGLAVTTGERTHVEKKCDLPDGWVRGFLQIGSAFLLGGALDAVKLELLPVHLHDLCRALRLRKAKTSPRALRWELVPGAPPVAILEPWEERLVLHGASHDARERRVVRTWGRQRLVLAERVIPLANRFVVHLLGRGLPWFLTARSGVLDFTLGLSGWTKNDWTQTARFDALVARRGARGAPGPRPLEHLRSVHVATPEAIAAATGVALVDVHASLVAAAGRGQVVYDLLRGAYRARSLFAGELPAGTTAGGDPQDVEARALLARGAVAVTGTRRELDGTTRLRGRVVVDATHVYEPAVSLSEEGGVAAAECACFFAKESKLKKGLCSHQLALLLAEEGPAVS